MSTSASVECCPTDHRLLIVDDEEIVVAALSETLRREGYQIVTTMNPVAALEMLGRDTFSVIISDQQMPQLSGLELLVQAKELQPEATRILITAVLDLDTVIDAINKGEVHRFIVKPWIREELLVTVKNAAQRHELVVKNAQLQAETQAANVKLLQLNQSLEEQVRLVARQNEQLTQLNMALERNLQRSVELCLHAMETFYPTLGRQARRVHDLSQNMAAALSLTAEQRQTLEIAAWLHDIGLVGVPRDLIKRWQENPADLSGPERVLIQQHPVVGQELAGFVQQLQAVGPTIRAHHERFDGQGYPDQLAGEAIPWLGRLLAVAVAYASVPVSAEGLEAVRQESGSVFDPEAVRALLRVVPQTPEGRRSRQVSLAELQPGMVLAKGIYTSNGLLLQPEGQPLTRIAIEKLLNHHRIQPIIQSLVVYC
jgi:response regulator RpfG family c-di-GMP phosphodiesterase